MLPRRLLCTPNLHKLLYILFWLCIAVFVLVCHLSPTLFPRTYGIQFHTGDICFVNEQEAVTWPRTVPWFSSRTGAVREFQLTFSAPFPGHFRGDS